jgi:hypothetical protein
MGGMHGMGPIQNWKDEPVYHERWESAPEAQRVDELRHKLPINRVAELTLPARPT